MSARSYTSLCQGSGVRGVCSPDGVPFELLLPFESFVSSGSLVRPTSERRARSCGNDGVLPLLECSAPEIPVAVCPVRRRGAGSVGAVEADDGVEVHEPAALVLGDLGVGQAGVVAELADLDSEHLREDAAQADGEAVPQLAGVGLPQHRADVLV